MSASNPQQPLVCVLCVLSLIYSGRQVCGRTSRGHKEEGHTGFFHLPSAVLPLISLARRIQPFFSLVDREVEFLILCTNDLIVLHLSFFCEEKSQFV